MNTNNTIYDISERAKVSTATVSRVLNGSDKVSEKTKARVLKVIEECGYEPNAFARGLGTGSMKTIGIMCSDVADIYLANAVSFLERGLREKGFNSILICTGYKYEDKVSGLKNLMSNKVDAIILVGSQYIESDMERNNYITTVAAKVPVMLLNGYLKGDNIYCNMSDDYQAYYDATDMLIKNGCKEILFLRGDKTYSSNLKLKGFSDALDDNGNDSRKALALSYSGRINEVKDYLSVELDEILSQGRKVDAVLTADDEIAIGTIKCLLSKGLRIPEDVSVVGCNNSVLAITCYPELSSIDNKCELLCVNTVNTLMRVLNGQDATNKMMVMSEFVSRNTTK